MNRKETSVIRWVDDRIQAFSTPVKPIGRPPVPVKVRTCH